MAEGQKGAARRVVARPRARGDLEYFDRPAEDEDEDDVVFVRDPVRGTFFRFNLLQAAMLRALDGTRTPAEIVEILGEQFETDIPEAAATRFVEKARGMMLLDVRSQGPLSEKGRRAVEQALRRRGAEPLGGADAAVWAIAEALDRDPGDRRARELYDAAQEAAARSAGATTDFLTFALFNPDRLLGAVDRLVGRFLFSPFGLAALVVLWGAGAWALTLASLDHAKATVGALAVVVVLDIINGFAHELGHGLACRHYGGAVREVGVMLVYYLRVAFYCDTSSSYLFRQRRHKVVVQLAGSLTTVSFLSCLAILLAVLNPKVAVYPGVALAFLLESTFCFVTLIPFMKFDGYYAICDALEVPNLRDRAFALARASLSERLLGVPAAREPLSPRVARLFLAYAAAAFVSTAGFIYAGYFRLLAPVVERFGGAGLVFALVLTVVLLRRALVWPVWQTLRLIVRERRRVFTPRRSAALAAIVAIAVGPWFVRWPVHVDGELRLVPLARADVRARTSGVVDEVLVDEGQRVRRGQVLARLRNDDLVAATRRVEAELAVADAGLARLRGGARPEELALARRSLGFASASQAHAEGQALLARQLADGALGDKIEAASTGAERLIAASMTAAARWRLALLGAGTRPEEIAALEAERERVDVELGRLRVAEHDLVLESPIDGVIVTSRTRELVALHLDPGERLLEVHDTSRFVAEIDVPGWAPIDQVNLGAPVAVRLNGAPGPDLWCEVALVRGAPTGAAPGRRDTPHEMMQMVTTPFAVERGLSGQHGNARAYGQHKTLAFARLYLPLKRLFAVRLWSLW